MMKGALTGGALWVTALAGSFYWGRLQSKDPEVTPVDRSDRVVQTPARTLVGGRDEIVANFENLLPERNDVLTHDELWLLADAWAAREPEAAVAWLSELEFDDVRNPYLFAALGQWASQDAEQARAWQNVNRPEKEESDLYLKAGLIRGMARTDPDAAIEFLLAQPKSLGRSAIDFVLGAWAQEGSRRVLKGISELPADLRVLSYEKVVSHLSPEMLPEVREFSMTHGSWEERNTLQKALADRWAQRSPREAMEWAAKIPSPTVTATVAKQWARQEPLEASAWLASRLGSPEYSLSARAVAWSVVGVDPQRAFAQVEAIRSESLRLETFEQMGRFWISDQPAQARAFFEGENPLPPDLCEALLSHFE